MRKLIIQLWNRVFGDKPREGLILRTEVFTDGTKKEYFSNGIIRTTLPNGAGVYANIPELSHRKLKRAKRKISWETRLKKLKRFFGIYA